MTMQMFFKKVRTDLRAGFGAFDNVFFIYVVVMLLALFSPSLFFAKDFNFYRMSVLAYLVAVMFLMPTIRNISIMKSWWRYLVYGGLASLIYLFSVNSNPAYADGMIFSNLFWASAWFILVVGYSESVIRKGLQQRTGSVILTSLIMGALHITSYSLLMGVGMSWALLPSVLVASIAFFIFYLVHYFTQDLFIEALVHGLFDFFVVGVFVVGVF